MRGFEFLFSSVCFEFSYFIIALSQVLEFNDEIEKSLNNSPI
jgi:hypothetical protein